MNLRELFKDQGIDVNALLRAPVGTKLEEGGGITVTIADGQLDVHILVATATPPKEK